VTIGPDVRLLRLLQLASPALPVGAYSYSQGLEAAIEAGIVIAATSAGRWIGDVLEHAVARLEAPLLRELVATWTREDAARFVT
jgi:urease accessory protein